MQTTISPTLTILAGAFATITFAEHFYHKLVTGDEHYKSISYRYKKLSQRQSQLLRNGNRSVPLSQQDKQKQLSLNELETNEYQANLTMLRKLKRSIKKERHLAKFVTAMVSAFILQIFTQYFKNIPVAKIPFKPVTYLEYFSTYQIEESLKQETIDQPYTYASAPLIFVLTFLAFRGIMRRTFFAPLLQLGRSEDISVSIPQKMLIKLPQNWDEFIQSIFGIILSTCYAAYSVYKALKKYNNIKYIVSFTRVGSRITGYLCAMPVPWALRYVFYGLFANAFGIDMSEVEEEDFGQYRTFTDFFTRRLKKDARKIDLPEDRMNMCSPCDGRILTCGTVNSEFSTIDCVKGRSYRLDEFMLGVQGDIHKDESNEQSNINSSVSSMLDKVKRRGNQLLYMVIYLSPSDYHRFHSPAYHTGDYRRHIVGYLSPVMPSHVNKHKDVFKNNERVNIFGRWSQGFYFESAVGAANVGSIKLDFDEDVMTNRALPRYPYFEDKVYVEGACPEKAGPFFEYLKSEDCQGKSIDMIKGEMTGRFEMGSTIVLIFEADSSTELTVQEGQKLSLGDKLTNRRQKN